MHTLNATNTQIHKLASIRKEVLQVSSDLPSMALNHQVLPHSNGCHGLNDRLLNLFLVGGALGKDEATHPENDHSSKPPNNLLWVPMETIKWQVIKQFIV